MAEPSTKKRILYVEDTATSRALVKRILEAKGFEVLEAEDGISGLHQAETQNPDLIIMDMNLPGMDGYEATTKIKSIPKLGNIPVIALTGNVGEGERERALIAGCDGYLQKPISIDKITNQIDEFLHGKKEKVETDKESFYLREYSIKLVNRLQSKIEELIDANTKLQEMYEQAMQRATTDGLTGLFNYRHFRQELDKEVARAERYKLSVSLMMIDIDYFKHYNDTNGHPAGDIVLKLVAEIMRKNLRQSDFVARYGGEEFVMILPETTKENIIPIAEKIRFAFEKTVFPYQEKQPNGNLTISAGIATFPDDAYNGESLIARADKALYEAKKRGRNRVCYWNPEKAVNRKTDTPQSDNLVA